MARDLELGFGSDLPLGDRFYGPAEWAGQGGGIEGEFERRYLRGTEERDRLARERLIGTGPYAGRGPRAYRRSHESIEEEANEALAAHPDLDATDIEVQVENGEITLTGLVGSRADRRLAEDIVESISGVRDVQNRLGVRDR
jgi:osmotically-inducible protein OsmY